MLLWEIRIVTFITNLLLLVGYALLYNWLQNTKFTNNIHQKLRTSYLVSITIAFLILFQINLENLVQTIGLIQK